MPSTEDPVNQSASKRKSKTDESSDKDDETTGKDIATSGELKLFAAVRGIKDTTLRVRSITTSVDACVREDIPGKEALVCQIDKDAKSLGILRHLVSVCLNALAEKDPSNPPIVNRTFIQQLFTRLSGNDFKPGTRSHVVRSLSRIGWGPTHTTFYSARQLLRRLGSVMASTAVEHVWFRSRSRSFASTAAALSITPPCSR